jgi:hypothetical protein
MSYLLKYLNYIGFAKGQYISKYSHISPYIPAQEISLAEKHLEYLKELEKNEDKRQEHIETKNAQILGQTGIIISILTIFITLFLEKISTTNIVLLFVLLFLSTSTLIHYIITISHATKTLEINKYHYVRRSCETVSSTNRSKTVLGFLNEEIDDIIFSINKNTSQNNIKADNLIYAVRSFKIASIGFALFTAIIITIGAYQQSTTTDKRDKTYGNVLPDSIHMYYGKKLFSVQRH